MLLAKRKPRNHLAALAMIRPGAGFHEKSRKAKRRADKVKLTRDLIGGVV